MIYDAVGVVESVGKTQTFGSGFTKREMVVDTREKGQKYPNLTKFTFKKERCGCVDGLRKGDEVRVRFAVEGRKWDGPKGTQYFVDLNAIDVIVHGGEGLPTPPPANDEPSSDDFPF